MRLSMAPRFNSSDIVVPSQSTNTLTNILLDIPDVQFSPEHDGHVDNRSPIPLSDPNILGLPTPRSGGANDEHIGLRIQKIPPLERNI